ncbi:hypothetical protein C8J56DRAFT_65411 [Mycena floridula]|nr:hypothetical protein C8J56DRAFT_65411 [Mycena floridula]
MSSRRIYLPRVRHFATAMMNLAKVVLGLMTRISRSFWLPMMLPSGLTVPGAAGKTGSWATKAGITRRRAARFVSSTLRLQRDMESWSSAIHPIRRVPNEIWREIFHRCCDGQPDCARHHTSLDPSLIPWTIIRVCSLWRNVAISLPALWSSITIQIPMDMDLESTVATRWASLLGNQLTCQSRAIAGHDPQQIGNSTKPRAYRALARYSPSLEDVVIACSIRDHAPFIRRVERILGSFRGTTGGILDRTNLLRIINDIRSHTSVGKPGGYSVF